MHIKTALVGKNPAQRSGQQEVETVVEGQSSKPRWLAKAAAGNGFWWRCITLPAIVGSADRIQKFPPRNRGRLDEICAKVETQNT